MNVVVLESEAYYQLQQNTFSYLNKLLKEERSKSASEWLDNKAAAELLGISARTLQTWRDEGLIGFSKIGNKIYYSRQEISRMLQNHAVKPFRALA